jgi:hypothetical protein
MAIYTDRAQGGVSRLPGQIELMVERKTKGSDNRGVNEHLNDPYQMMIKHVVNFEVKGVNSGGDRKMQLRMEKKPIVMVNSYQEGEIGKKAKVFKKGNELKNFVVRIDFERVEVKDYLIRLASYDKRNVKLSLAKLLLNHGVVLNLVDRVEEMSLDGTKVLKKLENWMNYKIEMKIKDMRTFKFELKTPKII